jgi:hypothetical protein
MGVILVAAIAVIVLSRERDTLVEDKEDDTQFVPELPPMEPPEDSN